MAERQDALVHHGATGVLDKYEQGSGRTETLQFLVRNKNQLPPLLGYGPPACGISIQGGWCHENATYSCLITVALGLSPVVALGDAQSHRKAAENLLIVMEVDKSLPKIADQVVETQLQQNPQLAPQREVLQRFLTKYVNWESVKEDTITAYTQEFTEAELKKLTEFYKTPVGKKASEKMPQLAFIAGQLGLKKAQAQSSGATADARRPENKPGGGG